MDDYDDIVNQLDTFDDSIDKKEEENEVPNDEDQEEDSSEDQSSAGNAELLNRKLKAAKLLIDKFKKKASNMENELKQLIRTNRLLTDKWEELEKVNEAETDDIIKENILFRQQCSEWKSKYEAQTVVLAQKTKENERLKELFEQTNEAKANLQEELQKMAEKNKNLQENIEMASLDYSKWMEWESREVFLYFMSINNGLLEKYKTDIESFLDESQVKGSDLATFEMGDVKDLGINVFNERKSALREIKNLIQGLSLNPKLTEQIEIAVDDIDEGTDVQETQIISH